MGKGARARAHGQGHMEMGRMGARANEQRRMDKSKCARAHGQGEMDKGTQTRPNGHGHMGNGT